MNGPGSRMIFEDTQVKDSLSVCLNITVGHSSDFQGGLICNADEIIQDLRKKYGLKTN